jgi:hypothetical protein
MSVGCSNERWAQHVAIRRCVLGIHPALGRGGSPPPKQATPVLIVSNQR